jgi:hypothetical protein
MMVEGRKGWFLLRKDLLDMGGLRRVQSSIMSDIISTKHSVTIV